VENGLEKYENSDSANRTRLKEFINEGDFSLFPVGTIIECMVPQTNSKPCCIKLKKVSSNQK